MKIGEILRQLADMIDSDQQDSSFDSSGPVNDKLMPADTYEHPDSDENAEAPEVFLPPLQMKLELLKKATGVDNVYDDDEEEEEAQHSYDELDAIKRNAGIVVLDALGDDEPLDN